MKQLILAIMLILMFCNTSEGQRALRSRSQPQVTNRIISFTPIRQTPTGNRYKFEVVMTPLVGLVGAPTAPFYSYFIDFGDGHVEQRHLSAFAQNVDIYHTYSIDHNQPYFDVRIRMYNNYSKGNPPPDARAVPTNVATTATAVVVNQTPIIRSNAITSKLKPGFIPHNFSRHQHYLIEPNDLLPFTVAYKNTTSDIPINGKVVLLFNETSQNTPNFMDLNNTRCYHDEAYIGSNLGNTNLPQARNYRNVMVWKVKGVQPGVEQQFFVDLKVLEIEEAVTTDLAVVFIPDNATGTVTPNNLTMTIMRSRDPNRSDGSFDDNAWGKRTYNYSVDFFNESDGPEREITIKCWDHRNNWDIESFELTEIKIGRDAPLTNQEKIATISEILPSVNDTIIIKLTGIYLNGLESVQLEDPEETVGYIKYKIRPKTKWKTTKAQAYIQFSNQEPVYTNKKKIFPQKRLILGLEGIVGLDEAGFNNWNDPNSERSLSYFLNYSIRGRLGVQLTDRYAIIGEVGYNSSRSNQIVYSPDTTWEETINGEDTIIAIDPFGSSTTANITNHNIAFNPQISMRLSNRIRVGAGVNLRWTNEVTDVDQTISERWISWKDRSNWLLDAQFTLLDTRFVDVNIGGRYYVPLDFNNRGQGGIYTALRMKF